MINAEQILQNLKAINCNCIMYRDRLEGIFTDAVTREEQIYYLFGAVKEVMEYCVQLNVDNIYSVIDNRIDENLEEINNKINKILNDYNNIIPNVNNALELYNKQVKDILKYEIDALTRQVNNELLDIRRYVDSQDNYFYNVFYLEIERLKKEIPKITSVVVKNPITGYYQDIQTVLDEIWDASRFYSLTADEYDNLQLTAEKYDNYNLTAFDYDNYARNLIYVNPIYLMYDPWTGSIVPQKNVILKLVELHRENGITATEYDGKNLTATAYEEKNISAYDYDWNGKTLL